MQRDLRFPHNLKSLLVCPIHLTKKHSGIKIVEKKILLFLPDIIVINNGVMF